MPVEEARMKSSTPPKPIETRYRGYRFRSRLEARWAVFLDALGIEWGYEVEGYHLPDGQMYLPDFWLPEVETFIEVKPAMRRLPYLEAMNEKAAQIGISSRILISYGLPGERGHEIYPFSRNHYIDEKQGECVECFTHFCGCRLALDDSRKSGRSLWLHGDAGSRICSCLVDYSSSTWDEQGARPTPDHPDLLKAIEKARGARFEFGESG
jgi:hypothetical protein